MHEAPTADAVALIDEPPELVKGIPLLQRLALSDAEAGALFRRSRTWWRRVFASGGAPAPVHIAGSTFWLVTDLVLWSESGCPGREDFELLKRSRPPRMRRSK